MWATVLYCEHAGEFLTLYRPLWLSLCIIVVKSTCINTRFIHFLLLQVIGGICCYCKTKEQKKYSQAGFVVCPNCCWYVRDAIYNPLTHGEIFFRFHKHFVSLVILWTKQICAISLVSFFNEDFIMNLTTKLV